MSKNKEKKGFFKIIFGYDDLVNNIKFTKKIVTEEKDKKYFNETFEEALERFNISEENKEDFLLKKYNEIRNISISNYFFSLLMFIFFTYYIFDSQSIYNIIPLLFFIYFTLKGFELSLRCYQIRKQKLGLLKDFLKDRKFWIPPKKL